MVWAGSCAAVVAILVGYDVALARYGEYLHENDYQTYLGLAWESVEAENFVDAMKHVDKAKRLAPNNHEPYSFAGSVHYRLGQWGPAYENMVKAIALGDSHPGSRADAVRAAIKLKRYDKAVELGLQYAEEVEDKASLLQYVADAHLQAGRPKEAIPYIEACLEKTPDNLYQLSRAETAYRAVGNQERAAEIQARIDTIHETIGQFGTNVQ